MMRYPFLHPIFMKTDLSSSKHHNLSSVVSLVTGSYSDCPSLKRKLISVSFEKQNILKPEKRS